MAMESEKTEGRKKPGRRMLFRAAALVLLAAIAAAMFVVGRGHTVYFDNKSMEYNGKSCEAYYKTVVRVGGEKVATLKEGDRGMASTMGQGFSMVLEITQEKEGKTVSSAVNMTLPYGMDGIVINIPALLAGCPEEAYLSEFVAAPAQEDAEDEEIVTDEFEMSDV